jgi:glutamate synthase (ferredoxin)
VKFLDLSPLTAIVKGSERYKSRQQNHRIDKSIDWEMIEKCENGIYHGEKVSLEGIKIKNSNRAFATILSNRISKMHGENGLPEDTIEINVFGSAGQSFGAFLAHGVTIKLEGIGNDYVGKGLSGGKISIKTPDGSKFVPQENTIIGNVALYGATDGEMYVNGNAGERFAVRNSGAKAVVEGVGDHGCEYMTGGVVVVIGGIGKNFAAGMSGGIAYVYDPEDKFLERCNVEIGDVSSELDEIDENMIKSLLYNHIEYTGSEIASTILNNWKNSKNEFIKVMPEAYLNAIGKWPDADARKRLPTRIGEVA